MALKKLLAVTLAVTFPLIAAAQTPAAEPAKPAPAPAPKVSVTPYGFIQATAYFDQNTFSAKDYPGQVAHDQIGGAFLMSARYSRFGVRLALDDDNWTGAKLGGVIEFDFKAGHLAGTSTTWYNGVMRLRLASMTATWKAPYGSWEILAGQNYGLVAPLFATSITWTADPLFWQAGNPWRRAPEARLTFNGSPEILGFNAAVGILSPQTADANAAPFTSADFGSGNASRMPSIEGRVGINTKFDPVSVAVGVAYEFGKRRVIDLAATPVSTKPSLDIDQNIFAVDVNLGSQFADLKGEWFTQSGAGDTYNTAATPAGTTANNQKAVDSSGFWAQLILKPVPMVWVHAGYGQEELDDKSLTDAGITTSTSIREKSSQIAAGVIFNAGKYWKFGVEGIQTTTRYRDDVEQDGTQVAVSTQFVF